MIRRETRRRVAGLAGMSLLLGAAGVVGAADRYFVGAGGGGTANWSDGANWAAMPAGPGGAGVPGPADAAHVEDSDAIDRNVLLDIDAIIDSLSIGNSGGGVDALIQNNEFNLTANVESLGSQANALAAHLQSAGTNTLQTLYVGYFTGSAGTYTLDSGALNTTGAGATAGEFVGYFGAGTFVQNGGTHVVGPDTGGGLLHLGEQDGASGNYLLGGDSSILNVNGSEAIGVHAPGTFTQSAGSHFIDGTLTLGVSATANGRFFFSGGSLVVTGAEQVGVAGSSTFTQSGGSQLVGAGMIDTDLTVGSPSGSAYELGGASSTLVVIGTEIIGPTGGSGMFNQTGGSNTTQSLALGAGTNSSGSYEITGGTLSVSSFMTVGSVGAGAFTQHGGSVSADTFSVGNRNFGEPGDGTYTLDGGTLAVSGPAFVGQSGAGTFVHSGGTFLVGSEISPSYLQLGAEDPNGVGTYIMNGADARLIVYGYESLNFHGFGTFIQSAGTNLVHGSIDTGDSLGNSRYFLSGGSLTVLGDEILDGGPFTHSGGTNTVGTVSANQDLLLGSVGRGGTYELNGASSTLVVYGSERIGDSSSGVFEQSAGSNTATTMVLVGGGSAGRGTLTLSGGTLTTPTLQIGGVGSFADTGGTFTYSGGALNVSTLFVAGHMTLAQGSHLVPIVHSLSIDNATAKVDLTDNNLIVDYDTSPGTLIDDTRQDLHDGALFTSVTSKDGGSTRLGYGDNAILHQSVFAGHSFPIGDFSQMLIKFTFAGDANLDGQVDVTDLGALATNWQNSGVWTDGDFNYDGFVDVTDLGLLATNWQAGVGSPLTMSFDQAMRSVGLPLTSVPEPIGASVLIGLALVLRRRCRRAKKLVPGRESTC